MSDVEKQGEAILEKTEETPKEKSEENVSEEKEAIEDTKTKLAEMYLVFLDKQKGGAIGTIAELGITINPMKKDAIAYMLTDTEKKEKVNIFKNLTKNLKKKLTEKITGGTLLEYNKTSLNKMKDLISQYKNDQAKLQELMTQIQEGVDPTVTAQIDTDKEKATTASAEEVQTAEKIVIPASNELLPKNRIFHYPLPGIPVLSPFGPRWGKHHSGVDISPKLGTPIKSIGNGEVEYIGTVENKRDGFEGYGNCVVIKSTGPDGKTYHTLYGHMKDEFSGKIGEKIEQGGPIGLVGNTGKSTGPHLHLEIREGDAASFYKNKAIDPLSVIPVTKKMIVPQILARIDKNLLIDETEKLVA